MDEISQWFEQEFGHLGFMLTPVMYNPDDFTPMKGVLWQRPNGTYIKTNIKVLVDVSNDVLEYKSLLRDYVNLFLESEGYNGDFKPKKKISKFKL
jgi:hypothetical protein